MKKSLKFIIFTTIWTISSSLLVPQETIKLPCKYKVLKNKLENVKGYKCYVTGKFEVKERGIAINGISRKDPDEYPQPDNYKDFSILKIDLKLVHYIPKGLNKYFGNLQTLDIISCELKEVTQEDLKVFPNLRFLNFQNNKIKNLEKDLFKFNLELEAIILSINNIQYIHPNIVDHLTKLDLLDFGGNDCIVSTAVNRSQVLNNIKNGIKVKCQNFGELEATRNLKKSGTQRVKYFWIFVGCGLVVGVFVVGAVVRIIYGILN